MLSYEHQVEALAALVEDWAIKKDRAVKGPFTSGDYVTYCLNEIFTPAGWSFTILSGPELITINKASAYIQLTGRLTIRFANGHEAHQDDIGIWPFTATKAKEGGTLADTAPERYETVLKAARTDCLKNAARNLGTCFAPLTDLELQAAIERRAYRENARAEIPKSTEEQIGDLFGSEPPQKPPEPELEGEASESPPEPAEPPRTGSGNGLMGLLEEVNAELKKRGSPNLYNHENHIKNAMLGLGYSSYKPSEHDQVVAELVDRKDPPF